MICLFSILLTGCKKEDDTQVTVEVDVDEEENMFGLTKREQIIYAEYAAGVLMKYNAGSNMRILEGQKLINEMAMEEANREQEARREQAVAEYEANKGNEDEDGEVTSSSGETSISYISDMSEAVGTEAFSVQYTGCEVTDSYPDNGQDMLLSVDASKGKVLLVTKYNVTNISQQTEEFDVFSKQPSFVLEMNGANYKAQYTLLLEDLSMYKGDIESGDTVETVLIFEVPESEASSISGMELSITAGGLVSSMQLEGGSVLWSDEEYESTESVESVEESTDIDFEYEEEATEEDLWNSDNTEDSESAQM